MLKVCQFGNRRWDWVCEVREVREGKELEVWEFFYCRWDIINDVISDADLEYRDVFMIIVLDVRSVIVAVSVRILRGENGGVIEVGFDIK